MKILITGGAGYIGSNVAYYLIDKGFEVHIIDNLSTGHRCLIPKKSKFFKISIQNKKVKTILINQKYDLVIHLAAYIQVEESVRYPKKYIENNYFNSIKFLKYCKLTNHTKIIFSSTAAVYGNPKNKLGIISESSTPRPTNPYAKSKLMIENYLKKNKKFNFVILRYFNVAGADVKNRSGQISKNKSTHLIKIICEAYFKKKKVHIFGNDYPSKDGTAIRDYIHITDLANAHYKSCNYLLQNCKSEIFNCGYGKGFTVKEVIETFNTISKEKINFIYSDRRLGDVFKLVSKNDKIRNKLKWKYKYNNLKYILLTSLKWEKKLQCLKKKI